MKWENGGVELKRARARLNEGHLAKRIAEALKGRTRSQNNESDARADAAGFEEILNQTCNTILKGKRNGVVVMSKQIMEGRETLAFIAKDVDVERKA